jgi:hypothetical protein
MLGGWIGRKGGGEMGRQVGERGGTLGSSSAVGELAGAALSAIGLAVLDAEIAIWALGAVIVGIAAGNDLTGVQRDPIEAKL